jgi:RecF/RecN/SMC N terminal domain
MWLPARAATQGIVFSVRPPKKSWKNISNLSGGEKTLSSLSLVFALHHYKPTPLYVMDEIDAALGEPRGLTDRLTGRAARDALHAPPLQLSFLCIAAKWGPNLHSECQIGRTVSFWYQ